MLLWLRLFDTRLAELVGFWLLLSLCNELLFGADVLRRILITNYSGFFASGILMFLLVMDGRSLPIGVLLAVAVALGTLQADLDANSPRERGVHLSHWIVVLLAVAAPLAVTACIAAKRLPIAPPICLALGALMYPLYLMHQTVGYILFNNLRWFGRPTILGLDTMIAMVLLCWLFYESVDRPLRALVNRGLKNLWVRWTTRCLSSPAAE